MKGNVSVCRRLNCRFALTIQHFVEVSGFHLMCTDFCTKSSVIYRTILKNQELSISENYSSPEFLAKNARLYHYFLTLGLAGRQSAVVTASCSIAFCLQRGLNTPPLQTGPLLQVANRQNLTRYEQVTNRQNLSSASDLCC